MSKLNRIDQQMVEEALPTGTTADNNPYDYGKIKAKRTEIELYTQAALNEAVKAENKACALELDIENYRYKLTHAEIKMIEPIIKAMQDLIIGRGK